MNIFLRANAVAFSLATLMTASPSFAHNGALDLIDKCIEAKDTVASETKTILADISNQIASAETATPTDEFNKKFDEKLREELRPEFDAQAKPLYESIGATVTPEQLDKAFAAWYDSFQTKNAADIETLRLTTYRTALSNYLKDEEAKAKETLEEQSKTVGAKCPTDGFNQGLRITLTLATFPITSVLHNWKSGEHGGFINQLIKAPTGIDMNDLLHGTISDASVLAQVGTSAEEVGGWLGDRTGIHIDTPWH